MNNKIYLIAISFVLVSVFYTRVYADTINCDIGYYDAGGFCKKEPTGCQYGDSIPIDICDKFTPTPQQQPIMDTPESIEEPIYIETSGK